MADIFTRILNIDLPASLQCDKSGKNPQFTITFTADGMIPFPQIILHTTNGQHLITGDALKSSTEPDGTYQYSATITAGFLWPGEITIQVEGCRKADINQAGGGDWLKDFRKLRLGATAKAQPTVQVTTGADNTPIKLYFGIHKHMHQPYYNTTDQLYWDGEKDGIFGSRHGPYTHFIPTAVRQYIDGNLPHAGLSTSWSGSLIEQLDRCAADGLCGGCFSGWNNELRAIAQEKTVLGHHRVDFSAFGFFHPLMPLIPGRDIIKQVEWHRGIIRSAFGSEASNVMFPPETAFHVRMIPALNQAGIKAIIYDSIHRFRSCQEYPYAGPNEGMLPPNRAEQVNPSVNDWLQLHNIWAGSQISPRLLRPEYVQYEDPDGNIHKIIAIPAERYIGNEDARGGFGALQYPDVLGQVYNHIVDTNSFDPKHPPFFLLHSDGDNHGGGADSYYNHNTGEMVRWLQGDPRFELTSVNDYLDRFPPDPDQAAHIEPGSWSGADNGDPQFMKWFSRYDQPYSPDLNSWAILTAFQNMAHSLEDAYPDKPWLDAINRLLLTAETSCYWYWTGQHIWDQQVTNAANQAYGMAKNELDSVLASGKDGTGPTIFAPWVIPENPGDRRWGQGGLVAAPREGVVHTFVYDITGLKRVTLILHGTQGETHIAMTDNGAYPSQTGAAITANYFTAQLPVGMGDVRYYIEAEDGQGNISRGALERIYMA
ncbi:MAG: glycosyl hydrolase family 57 [Candidatus Contendobacter odensis]|uniref:Glycosyl hydrolase family 57 n=1 Tax=Candidatus Contendibacter odensensis TaxID=1400860 RepID=A0A2G6PFP3_9GAMM|nr:MAG: glycosyl hydrolase family 57 [Candidatus Contendobacter odensis]